MDEKIRADEVVNRILDAESAGYTNISEALRVGGIELAKITNRAKFGILVTDGTFNRGEDPRSEVSRFRKLHVMGLPSNVGICVEIPSPGTLKPIVPSAEYSCFAKGKS